jgi:hypothetical protein
MATITLGDTTSAGLVKAIKAAGVGDTILVPSSDYRDDFILDGASKTGVTVKAKDKRYLPRFTSRFYVKNSSGITFDTLESSGAISLDMPVQIINCQSVTISHWYIHGSIDNTPNDLRGMLVRACSNCLVVQNRFEELSDALGWLDGNNITVRQNVFYHIADNCMAGGGTNNLEIGGNIGSSFRREASSQVHPDFVQNWGTAGNPQPTGLLIRGNVYVMGLEGWLCQGVWISDPKPIYEPQPGSVKYPGTVRIHDNIVIGTVYNGLVVNQPETVEFQRNIVLGTEAQWTCMAGRAGDVNDGHGGTIPGPQNSKTRYKDNISTRVNQNMSGMMVGNSEFVDDGGNREVPLLTQAMADQLYRDYDEIFIANGSWAVGFYDKYRARVLERLGL